MAELLWQPTQERRDSAQISLFGRWLQQWYGLSFDDYQSMHQWSVNCPAEFWQAIWDFIGIRSSQSTPAVLQHRSRYPLSTFADYRWFEGARLNFAENLLRFVDTDRADQPALISYLENGRRRTLTYQQLWQQVAQLSAALRADGVIVGDRVVAYLPNIIETVVAMLATSSIGAIWSSCSPDFGVNGVQDRFGQIEPKIIFVADGYYYNGKWIDMAQRNATVVANLKTVQRVVSVTLSSVGEKNSVIQQAIGYADYLSKFGSVTDIKFAQLPFDHPLYILYSSGTTGAPKCIVHGAGGTLLQHLKELILHSDVKPDSVIFYYTTCGWMMWNWLVSALGTGASVVLYDGSPFAKNGHLLWDIIDRQAVTHFGTSAKYLSALEKSGIKPRDIFGLKKLQTVLSTGSPLSDEGFRFVYREIKTDLCLSSICGGTDIVSSFMLGNPALPVYAGEIQCAGLGMAVEVFDDCGKSLVSEKGELVCSKPFPSCPIGFWNDQDGKKFHAAYFAQHADVWTQGDYVEITSRNGVVVYGRSDAVLNPGGVRIGTAEIYRQVEKLDVIIDSIVIGQQWQDDVRVVLFVVLREGMALDDRLRETIRQLIKVHASPRHVPAKIIQISEVPRTISGKIVELAVRNMVHNQPIKNVDALANPQALAQFKNMPELQL
jgi:acetoacetyl-CoA synthetase